MRSEVAAASSNPVRDNTGARAGSSAWPIALLVTAVCAGLAAAMTWVRAVGSPIPDSTDVDAAHVTAAGASEHLSVSGVHGGAGTVALVLSCALAVVALWRFSPAYRPVLAGYVAIAVSALGIAMIVWFCVDDAQQLAILGSSMDIHTDTVETTVWPWITVCCFVATCLVGVMLVPRERRR